MAETNMPPQRSKWQDLTDANPQHSRAYAQRFRDMAAQGDDVFGEARLIDAVAARHSTILDAGCGPGRLGGYLHGRGHTVTGVDLDPELIAAAEQDYPGPRWVVGDLAQLELGQRFDLIFCAGNVLAFLHPDTRVPVLEGFARHLDANARVVVGFGAGRGYDFGDFADDVRRAGLAESLRFSTWDLLPWAADSDFLVAILTHGQGKRSYRDHAVQASPKVDHLGSGEGVAVTDRRSSHRQA